MKHFSSYNSFDISKKPELLVLEDHCRTQNSWKKIFANVQKYDSHDFLACGDQMADEFQV